MPPKVLFGQIIKKPRYAFIKFTAEPSAAAEMENTEMF